MILNSVYISRFSHDDYGGTPNIIPLIMNNHDSETGNKHSDSPHNQHCDGIEDHRTLLGTWDFIENGTLKGESMDLTMI